MTDRKAKQHQPLDRPPLAIKRVTDTQIGRALADLHAKWQHREISMNDYIRECARVRESTS